MNARIFAFAFGFALAILGHAYADNLGNEVNFSNRLIDYEINRAQQNDNTTNWIKRADIHLNMDSNFNLNSTFGLVQPLSSRDNEVTLAQTKLSYNNITDEVSNFGVGYRKILPYEQMIGINMFNDYYRKNVVRSSIGFEYFICKSEIHLNFYHGQNMPGYAINGYDYEFKARLPYLSWMTTGIRGYNWKDQKEYRINVTAQATPHLSVKTEYRSQTKDYYYEFKYDFLNQQHPAAFEKGKTIIRSEKVDMKSKLLHEVIRENKLKEDI